MILFGLLALPFIVGALIWFYNRSTISGGEYAIMFVATAVVGLISYQVAKMGALQSTERWNGRITDKDSGVESCCHCREVCTARDSKGNCTASRQECDHILDNWWSADVSSGDVIMDDCNGSSSTPGWWENAYIGEPAAVEHSYTNYLKADPESLIRPASKKYMGEIPDTWPSVKDWYKVERVLRMGPNAPAIPDGWRKALDEMNADLGVRHQVDVMVVLTSHKDPEFADALEAKWLFGPKNAVIVVLGSTDGATVQWARVISISEVELLKINLRDSLPGKPLGLEVLTIIETEVGAHFKRTPMEKYSYLESVAEPTPMGAFLAYIVTFAVLIALATYFHREDVV